MDRTRHVEEKANLFLCENGTTPDDDALSAICDQVGLRKETFHDTQKACATQLHSELPKNEVRTLRSIDSGERPLLELEGSQELLAEIHSLVSEYSGREGMILRARFGFGEEIKTLQEIGEFLGITRERVRQLEKECLEEIRRKVDPLL